MMKKILSKSLFFALLVVAKIASAQMVLEYEIITPNTQISIPLSGTVNVSVDWGDGTEVEKFTSTGNKPHTYTTIGTKTVTISGSLTAYGGSFSINNARLSKVLSWDGLGIRSFSLGFYNVKILTEVPNSLPSTVTNLSSMFRDAASFNAPIGTWDTEAVTDMSYMFYEATSFNQPIGNWNTAKVTNMSGLFGYAKSFNQPIGTWNTSAVTNMSSMFEGATSFNQPIGTWNTAKVTDMYAMFSNATSFNQPIGSWNTISLKKALKLFEKAVSFNQPLGTWNTGAVTDMGQMFDGATSFNESIGTWNTGSVKDMLYMFRDAKTFNQPIGNWNTSAVTNMTNMFIGALAFNQPIGNWNTSAVTNMSSMFVNATSFNQAIQTWNTANVTSMLSMFHGAISFDKPLGKLNIQKVESMNFMFNNAKISTCNYDSTLILWSKQPVKSSVNFSGGSSKYSAGTIDARNLLISKNWTITDGGLDQNHIPCSNTTALEDDYLNIQNKTLLKTYNLQGHEITEETEGIQIRVYSDGSRKKVYYNLNSSLSPVKTF